MEQVNAKTTRYGLSRFVLAGILASTGFLSTTKIVQAAPSVTATAVSAGNEGACALISDGRVQCWGNNYYGTLGNGTNNNSLTPVVVVGISSATTISSGAYHNCVVEAGAVKCWGWNGHGQLGDGTTTNRNTPVPVSGLGSGVVAVSAGETFSCALMSTGTVKCWGSNIWGVLGNGTTAQSLVPVDVTGLSGIVAISAGATHSCALTSGGAALCLGYNFKGALGNGTFTETNPVPVSVTGLGSGVAAVNGGLNLTCAITSGGAAKCWGSDEFGALGNGNGAIDGGDKASTPVDVVGLSSGVSAIGAGLRHACAVAGGIAKCWGSNHSGQLGNGTNTDSDVPVNVVNLTNVKKIGAGIGSSCAVVAAGDVYCWGANFSGQLGNGTLTDSNVPVNVSLLPPNTPPTANAGGPYSGSEGSVIALGEASASDLDGDPLSYSWSVSSSLCSFDDASAVNPNLSCSDNGAYTATLSVSDGVNPAVNSNASVTVSNVAPTLGAISVDTALARVGTTITASANFTDPGTLDTHTAAWDWGDGASAGTVAEAAGSGSVSDSHSYSVPGVYAVALTVTDKDGGVSNESIYQYVVVYDPSAGFVTGGGWIDSPAGAYTADSSLTGNATFGFVSRYQKGATVPSGKTEFQFEAGEFNFHSETYDWLVVNQGGANAQFKGSGTVNGARDPNGNAYKFMLWGHDGSPDTLRIQIWWEDSAGTHIVYDNGFGQAIGGGNIVVHKGS